MSYFIRGLLISIFCLSTNSNCQVLQNLNNLNDSTLNKLNSTLKTSRELLDYPQLYFSNDFSIIQEGLDFNALGNQRIKMGKDFNYNKYFLQKIVNSNIHLALKNSIPQSESETLTNIRKYLGISKNIFALILAIISVAKYH